MNNEKAGKHLQLERNSAKLFSKDRSTQVGARIIGAAGEVRSTGYNGAPRGCRADEPEDPRTMRPEKYYWFEHAERNAIYNAARAGTATLGCTLLITHPPCMDCARAAVQAGIAKVMWEAPTDPRYNERWGEHMDRVLELFTECGVAWEIL